MEIFCWLAQSNTLNFEDSLVSIDSAFYLAAENSRLFASVPELYSVHFRVGALQITHWSAADPYGAFVEKSYC